MATKKNSKTSTKAAPASNGLVKQGAKFGLVGISNTLIDFTVYSVVNAVFHVPVSSAFKVKYLSGTVAMINSFYWNRRWTFKSRVGVAKSGAKFVVATVVSVYLIQPGLVHFFTNAPGVGFGTFWYNVAVTIGLGHVLSQGFVERTVAFGMGVIGSAVWDFTLYKLWAFRK
jgi:putative flippase GtrA